MKMEAAAGQVERNGALGRWSLAQRRGSGTELEQERGNGWAYISQVAVGEWCWARGQGRRRPRTQVWSQSMCDGYVASAVKKSQVEDSNAGAAAFSTEGSCECSTGAAKGKGCPPTIRGRPAGCPPTIRGRPAGCPPTIRGRPAGCPPTIRGRPAGCRPKRAAGRLSSGCSGTRSCACAPASTPCTTPQSCTGYSGKHKGERLNT